MFLTATLALLLCLFVTSIAFKYALSRRKIRNKFSGKNVYPFPILWALKTFLLPNPSRMKYSLNVYILQAMAGQAELKKKAQFMCLWIGFEPIIVIKKAEAVEALLSSKTTLEKSSLYDFFKPVLGTGLVTSSVSKWKLRRKMLTPAFHYDILKGYLPVFNERANVLVGSLRKEINEEFTDIQIPIRDASLDIICETVMGVNIKACEIDKSKYFDSFARITEGFMKRAFNVLYWFDFIYVRTRLGKEEKHHTKILLDSTRSVIQEKKKELLLGGGKTPMTHQRLSVMDLLLKLHIETKSLTEEDVAEEVITFMAAGYESATLGISWSLYLIGLHKDVQEKVQEELEKIFGNDAERPATADDLNDMKYLDCVIKEAQRLYTTFPLFGRQLTEDLNICGHTIPKGFNCFVFSHSLHRDEDVFPIPEKFDPERFLPENSIGRHRYAFVPFSAGPRNCIGQRFAHMEEKVLLSTILRNFTVQSLDERDKIPVALEFSLVPVGPIRLKIRPRHCK